MPAEAGDATPARGNDWPLTFQRTGSGSRVLRSPMESGESRWLHAFSSSSRVPMPAAGARILPPAPSVCRPALIVARVAWLPRSCQPPRTTTPRMTTPCYGSPVSAMCPSSRSSRLEPPLSGCQGTRQSLPSCTLITAPPRFPGERRLFRRVERHWNTAREGGLKEGHAYPAARGTGRRGWPTASGVLASGGRPSRRDVRGWRLAHS